MKFLSNNTSTAGPDDLANLAIAYRQIQSKRGAIVGNISESGLRQLIGMAHAVSLMREEGTFVTLQMHVLPENANFRTGIVPAWFESELELSSPDILRKLAPASPVTSRAIIVGEKRGTLIVRGILEIRRDEQISPFGVMSLSMQAGSMGSSVAILGPGRIAIYDCFPMLELRAGRIVSPIVRYIEYPRLMDAFEPIIQSIFDGRAKFGTQPDDKYPATFIPYLFSDTWQRVIRAAVRAEHGGAFAILPTSTIAQVEMKHQLTPLPFGKYMFDFWEKHGQYEIESSVPIKELYAWRDARTMLEEATRSLTFFSQVDGCVVLDQTMNVLGFGAKLLTTTGHTNKKMRFVNGLTGETDDILPNRIAQFGTRHSSAFNFCCANPGAIIIVISQDGDVRIFFSNESEIAMIEATEVAPEIWSALDTTFSGKSVTMMPKTPAT